MRAFAVILFFCITNLFAQDCSDVAIETKHMPKNNNQNQHNWCVFWASADLYSFYEESPLSSYDMALQYFNNDQVRIEEINDYSDTGANMTAALIIAQQGKGLCLESQTNFTDSDWAELSVMFKRLSDPNKSLIEVICENQYHHSRPFKDIPVDILKILDQLSGDKKTAALLDISCGKRHQFKHKYGVGMRSIENSTPEKMVEKLDLLLQEKKPATISYDWDFIINSADYVAHTANHTSTIIGRRKNPATGKCEYQIKDSAGNRCPKKAQYECNKDNGTLWIPKEALIKNIFEINWLNKR